MLLPIVDIAALPDSAWLVLSADGLLSQWQPLSGEVSSSIRLHFDHVPLPDAAETEAGPKPHPHEAWPRLHASQCGRWAAIVQDRGRHGVVLKTADGAPQLVLDGGDYCAWTVPFALAFSEHRGRPVVIHRSHWNRLDVTDLTTCQLLTARELPDRSRQDRDREHDLDYFHGALYPSPDGSFLYDDGWVWQPFGYPVVWSMAAWLESNVYESEDGPTLAAYSSMEEWDGPVVWIRGDRLAHRDAGDDEDPACVFILDPTATEPGRGGHPRMKTVCQLPDLGPGPYFTDGEHLLVTAESGLRGYDIGSGEQLFAVDGFRPTRQDPHTRTLIQIDGGTAYAWTPAAG